jgi:hypothetical protein
VLAAAREHAARLDAEAAAAGQVAAGDQGTPHAAGSEEVE